MREHIIGDITSGKMTSMMACGHKQNQTNKNENGVFKNKYIDYNDDIS